MLARAQPLPPNCSVERKIEFQLAKFIPENLRVHKTHSKKMKRHNIETGGKGCVNASLCSLVLLANFLPTAVQISIAISQPYLVCPPHKTAMPLDCMLVISC